MVKIDILFEDDDIVAISKPYGISVHGDGKSKETTISDWVLKHYPETKDVGEPIELSEDLVIQRHGIVHRLDKNTSGVLLIAKTEEGFHHLKDQFKEREIKKTYFAFVYGKMRGERGTIERPIARAQGSVRKWACLPLSVMAQSTKLVQNKKTRGDAREAITKYKVIWNRNDASFVEVWPLTGRTHQIRVHMKSIGHPVVMDDLYAPGKPEVLGFDRLALHAGKIVFEDVTGRTREIKAPFPDDFVGALAKGGIEVPVF